MRPFLTAVIAAIEAAAVAVAGLAALAVAGVLLWGSAFGFAAEPSEVAVGVTGVWLLAHLVPLALGLDAPGAVALGLPPEALDLSLSLPPLGLTLVTVLLAARAGARFCARGGIGAAGILGGALGFGAAAVPIALLGAPLSAWPLGGSVLVPGLVYGAASGLGFLTRSITSRQPWWGAAVRGVRRALHRRGPAAEALPDRVAEIVRLALAALAALVGLAALGVAVAIAVGYIDVVSVGQSLQLDPLGVILVFFLHVTLLPVLLTWSMAWFLGSGFSVGMGTLVSPGELQLGPVPSLPILGAIPDAWGDVGLLAPMLVVLLGVGLGVLGGSRAGIGRTSWVAAAVVPLGAAVLVGLALAGLAALASGDVGTGRLVGLGPNPWLSGALAAAELGGGLLLGVVLHRLRAEAVAAESVGEPAEEVPAGSLSESAEPAEPAESAESAEDTPSPLRRIQSPGRLRRRVPAPDAVRGEDERRSTPASEAGADRAQCDTVELTGEQLDTVTPAGAQNTTAPAEASHDTAELARAFSWDSAEGTAATGDGHVESQPNARSGPVRRLLGRFRRLAGGTAGSSREPGSGA